MYEYDPCFDDNADPSSNEKDFNVEYDDTASSVSKTSTGLLEMLPKLHQGLGNHMM